MRYFIRANEEHTIIQLLEIRDPLLYEIEVPPGMVEITESMVFLIKGNLNDFKLIDGKIIKKNKVELEAQEEKSKKDFFNPPNNLLEPINKMEKTIENLKNEIENIKKYLKI